ncbi:MAG: calcineurin-like phosphoesterase C-terminal domain-containing protein [Bacteroidales bacterium]|nr:calcineurin-like phosphoesterase C-terminal domain-containing protein [Bacteroidales bacterium]
MVHRNFIFFLAFSCSFLFPAESAFSSVVSGRVFLDCNGNGVFDRGDRPLKGIPVSDGDTIIFSGAKGRYSVDISGNGALFVILPDGFSASGAAGIMNGGMPVSGYMDFPLRRTEKKKDFRMAAVGDIQADNNEQIDFASRTILKELASRHDLDFLVHMGDMVNDKPRLLQNVCDAVESVGEPAWCVIGNHDLDMGRRPRKTMNFKKIVGNDVTAFRRGDYCFVLLDNVELGDTALPAPQIRFLKNLVSILPDKVSLVLCQHVPMSGMKNRDKIFSALGHRKTLVVSAHAHTVFRKHWSDKVEEVSVGATCGSWWTGERNSWGIPVALMQGGSPRCYFIFDFSGDGYTFRFKGVGMDPSIQAGIWVRGENSSDDSVKVLASEPKGRFAVNVYGGGETTSVEYSIDNNTWLPLDKVRMIDPTVSRISYMNHRGGYPTEFSRRQPLRRSPSPHIWAATLPENLFGKPLVLHIRVRDSAGLAPFDFSRPVFIR